MGISAIMSSASAGVSPATSLLTPTGVSIGSIFITVSLIVLLAYLDLFNASERDDDRIRTTLVSAVIPLSFTFAAIVLFEALAVI